MFKTITLKLIILIEKLVINEKKNIIFNLKIKNLQFMNL